MKRTISVLALVFLAMSLSSCKFEAPRTTFKRYEIKHVGISRTDLSFIFDVENPNDIPIRVSDISYAVDLDGNPVTSGSSEGFSLNGRETKESEFPIVISYADLLGPATGLAQKFITRNGTVEYKIYGELTIRDNIGTSARVPLDAEGVIKLF